MPFANERQRRACYAKNDKSWDCKQWERETDVELFKKTKEINRASSSVELLSLLTQGMKQLGVDIPCYVVCKDEPPLTGKKALGRSVIIVNLDDSKNEGTHWVLLYMISPRKGVYIDPFGFPPPNSIVERTRKDVDIIYSDVMMQDVTSEMCGFFCVANALLIAQEIKRGETSSKAILTNVVKHYVSGKDASLSSNNLLVTKILSNVIGINNLN